MNLIDWSNAPERHIEIVPKKLLLFLQTVNPRMKRTKFHIILFPIYSSFSAHYFVVFEAIFLMGKNATLRVGLKSAWPAILLRKQQFVSGIRCCTCADCADANDDTVGSHKKYENIKKIPKFIPDSRIEKPQGMADILKLSKGQVFTILYGNWGIHSFIHCGLKALYRKSMSTSKLHHLKSKLPPHLIYSVDVFRS